MNTSYYAKCKDRTNVISIAGKAPEWYRGNEYKKLAPKYWFWKKWHDKEMSNEDYIINYKLEVLDVLDARTVLSDLCRIANISYSDNPDLILLCHETSKLQPNNKMKFCHRHIVELWFKLELGLIVSELQ